MKHRSRLIGSNRVDLIGLLLLLHLVHRVHQHGSPKRHSTEAAGIHHTYVGLLERGERKPTIDVADRVARALGKKLSALIAEAERAHEV